MTLPDESNRSMKDDLMRIGRFTPPLAKETIERPDAEVYRQLEKLPGLSATVSDILDDLGYRLALPGTKLRPVTPRGCVVGPAMTLGYLPERKRTATSKLAHQYAFSQSKPGDVLVIQAEKSEEFSVMGGLAASQAVKAGIAGVLVDGSVRDIDQIVSHNLKVWSRGVTCITGKGKLEGYSWNYPISFGGVQVCPGDLAIADDSGICFVPSEVLGEVCRKVLAVYNLEFELEKGENHGIR